MKKFIVSILLTFALVAVNTYAADQAKKTPSPAQQAQQERMKACSKDAKEQALKGDERKVFMKKCLSGKTADAEPEVATATQQDKMKACSRDAKDKALKGDDRKKFMSECLKK